MPIIVGTSAPEVLQGSSGSDTISGHGGADTVTGGGGADTFVIGVGESPTAGAINGHPGNLVRILDWGVDDKLVFTGEVDGTPFNTVGLQATDFDDALTKADSVIGALGKVYVLAQVGPDLFVIDNQHQAVELLNTIYFAGVSYPNLLGSASTSPPPPVSPPPVSPPPISPPPPPPVVTGATATIFGNLDAVQLSHLLGTDIVSATSTRLELQSFGVNLVLSGFGFTFNADEQLTGGTVTFIHFSDTNGSGPQGQTFGEISGISISAEALVFLLAANSNSGMFSTLFAGNDSITGTGSNLLRGYDGDDTITSSGFGPQTLFGGPGNDSLVGAASDSDYLNGGPGVDTLAGGTFARTDFFEFASGDSPAAAAAGGHLDKLDHIIDWTNENFIIFTGGVVATPSTYAEVTAASFDDASAVAQANLGHGIDFTVAQVGADLIVFGLRVSDAVVIANRTLADISQFNVGGNPVFRQQPPPGASPTAGDDQLQAGSGSTSIDGGAGADSIAGWSGGDVLRGGDGNDSIQGGSGFDDVNGNKGDDTISDTQGGDDWLVGGQGNDLISATVGGNILYGNLGNDTLHGGSGAEIIRGGQGDDSITGGAGADFISGDRGNDTISGGPGADSFHTFSGAGIDRVLDFNLAEGDRVQVDAGTTWTVTQIGADTVIDMSNGDQMILVGVDKTMLTGGWIFTL